MKVARPAATAAVLRPRRAPDLAVSHSTVAAATKEAITAYIGIGANLGDPLEQVTSAIAALATLPMTRLLGTSSAYRSAPMGGMRDDSQPDYVNAVVRIQTLLDARTLLDRLLDIENRHGRFRSFPNAPRTLDLDLLLFGEQQIDQPGFHASGYDARLEAMHRCGESTRRRRRSINYRDMHVFTLAPACENNSAPDRTLRVTTLILRAMRNAS